MLVDKPVGWTSFDVVSKLRGGLRQVTGRKVKVGHAGTLDPLASGLLVLAYGKRTKELPGLTGLDKVYQCTLALGHTTPSYDAETEPIAHGPWEHLTQAHVEEVLTAFRGEIQQRPPVFSAKHHKGERAYFLAREGVEVEMPFQSVRVDRLELTSFLPGQLELAVACGKGTYIRSLAHDIGQALGCGAYLSALRRTHIGPFSVDDARDPHTWSQWFHELMVHRSGDGLTAL